MKYSSALFLTTIVAAACLSGCKKGPVTHLTNMANPTLTNGWTLIENKEHGLAIGAPGGWATGTSGSMSMSDMMPGMGATDAQNGFSSTAGGQDAAQMNKLMSDMEKQDAAQQAEEVKKLEEKNIYISVINKGMKPVPGEERTRFTVKREKVGNANLDDAAKALKDELINEGPVEKVDLPIGKAIRIKAVTTNRDGGVVTRIYYALCDGDDEITVRFTTEGDGSVIESIAKPVMETLRVR